MDYLLRIDRRFIFALLFVCVTAAVKLGEKLKFPIEPSAAVKGIYSAIDALPPRAPVLVAIDYDPASNAELDPMAFSALRQIFRKNLRMISMTHWPTGAQMASDLVQEMATEFDDVTLNVSGTALENVVVNVGRRTGPPQIPWSTDLLEALRAAKVGSVVEIPLGEKQKAQATVVKRTPTLEYGKDYCFLGTKAGEQVLVLTMGQSITTAFPTDPRTGKPTGDLPVMKGVDSLKDLAYLLELGAGSSVDWWVKYGAQRYGFRMGVGCTAVMAPDEYPYYGAGMITGLAGGLKGAWEYEKLVETPGTAMRAIPAQTVAHLLVIALIVFCNVAHFWKRAQGGAA